MKPHDHIKKSKRVINELKHNLKYSNNELKDAEHINILIDTINCMESMLECVYETDIIDTLLLNTMHEQLFKHILGKEVPLHEMVEHIDKAIYNGKEDAKNEVIRLLKDYELKYKLSTNTLFTKKSTNFNPLITELLNEFKAQIEWKKST